MLKYGQNRYIFNRIKKVIKEKHLMKAKSPHFQLVTL